VGQEKEEDNAKEQKMNTKRIRKMKGRGED
jgi:hypothetical protein